MIPPLEIRALLLVVPESLQVFCEAAKFQGRDGTEEQFFSLDCDAVKWVVVLLTTLARIEQLPNDADCRTLGDAVIFIGTVQVALNEAERCTWPRGTGGCWRGVGRVVEDDKAVAMEMAMDDFVDWCGCCDDDKADDVNVDDDDDDDDCETDGNGEGIAAVVAAATDIASFFGDGVHDELNLC